MRRLPSSDGRLALARRVHQRGALRGLPDPAHLIVDALATYRITRLVVTDEITRGPRDWLLERVDPDPSQPTRLGYLLGCPWCVSVWAGLAVVAARRLAPRAWTPVSTALAFSAAAGLLHGFVE